MNIINGFKIEFDNIEEYKHFVTENVENILIFLNENEIVIGKEND